MVLKTVGAKIPVPMYNEIRDILKQSGLSQSDFVRRAVQDLLIKLGNNQGQAVNPKVNQGNSLGAVEPVRSGEVAGRAVYRRLTGPK